MCLKDHVRQFFCLVSNFSHTYLVKAHGVELATGTDSSCLGAVRDLNHGASLHLFSINSLKIKCFFSFFINNFSWCLEHTRVHFLLLYFFHANHFWVVKSFSYPSVAASSASLCYTKNEGNMCVCFWILFHYV